MAKIEIKLDSQIQKAIKEAIKAQKTTSHPIAGFKGLEVRVRPHRNGLDATTDFRHRYTHPITGKRPYMTLGQYPALTLADAKNYHKDNDSLLTKGIDPIENRKVEKQKKLTERKNTLNHFIAEWLEKEDKRGLAPATHKSNDRLTQPIREQLGHMPVTQIDAQMVYQFINGIYKVRPYKAVRVLALLASIFQIPLANMMIEYNPATNLKGLFPMPKANNMPAITEPAQFAELLKDIDQLDDTSQLYNKRILQLLALTFVRIGDLCSMKWSDINWLTKTWEFEQQKGASRSDMQPSLVVPLAPQALAILSELKELTGDNEYVFYNARRKKASYHNPREINKILNSELMNDGDGYMGIHCPHGFRASAKTMLTERLGYGQVYTELQLGHKIPDLYGSAYNRMEGIDKRREMMNDWANYLDKLKAGDFDNILYPNFKQAEQVKHG